MTEAVGTNCNFCFFYLFSYNVICLALIYVKKPYSLSFHILPIFGEFDKGNGFKKNMLEVRHIGGVV